MRTFRAFSTSARLPAGAIVEAISSTPRVYAYFIAYSTVRGRKETPIVRHACAMGGYRFCLGLLDVWLPSDNYSWNCPSRRVCYNRYAGYNRYRHCPDTRVYVRSCVRRPTCVALLRPSLRIRIRYPMDSNYEMNETIPGEPRAARDVLRKIDIDFLLMS